MTKKHSKIRAVLGGIAIAAALVVGGVGVYIGINELNGLTTSVTTTDNFSDLDIATEQYENYDGTAKTPTLDLPEGYSYEITSIKDAEGNSISEAIELGVYTFTVKISYRISSRTYTISLTIKNATGLNVQENQNSTLLKISKQLLTSGTDDSGYEYQEVSYEVNGTLSASAVEGSLAWADTTSKVMSEYMTFSIDTTAQTVRLTCLQAFDTQIVFTLTSTELNTATASLTIDYEVKLLKDSKPNFLYNNNDVDYTTFSINNGDLITVETTEREYSIGTISSSNDFITDELGVTSSLYTLQNLNSIFTINISSTIFNSYNYIYYTLPSSRNLYSLMTHYSMQTSISNYEFISRVGILIASYNVMESIPLDFDYIIEECSPYLYFGDTEEEAKASTPILLDTVIADFIAGYLYSTNTYFILEATYNSSTDYCYFSFENFMSHVYGGNLVTTFGSIDFEENNIIF